MQRLRALATLLVLVACARGTMVAPAPAPLPEGPLPGPRPTTALALDDPLPTDPALTVARLDNGLTYYVRANAEPRDRIELWLVVDAGSVLEDADQRGLAHLVEHMAFNGTRRFGEGELVDFLERIGMQFGPDVNARTGFDETIYMLRLPADAGLLDQALEVLEDWAAGIAFDAQALERERGVVIEEWRQSRGASARLRDQQIPLLFRGSRYAERLPIGDPEVLATASPAALERFYRDWYRPELMAVIAVGDFEERATAAAIRRRFRRLPAATAARPRPLVPVPDHEQTLVGIMTDPEATTTGVGIFTKMPRRPQSTVRDYRRLLAEELYHGMLNRRLDELRRRPDPPFLWAGSSSGRFVRSRDVYTQSAGVRPGELLRGLEALLAEIERVDRHGFTAGELEREKQEMLRRYESAWAERDQWDSADFAAEYSRHFLDGEPAPGILVELQLVQRLLPEIRLDELNRLAEQWISEENRVVLVSAPEAEAATLPGEEELLATLAAAAERPIEPYVDTAPQGPLLARPPPPGPVVETHRLQELGVTEWRLANGVRVVVKPTDFRHDQVLLAASSPGGHSLAADEAFRSASFADLVVAESGIGELGRIELEKALAGRLVRVQPHIDALQEGVTAIASPRDLEVMLQVVHLSFTAPRLDREAFAAFRTRTEALLRNRLARPEAVFADRLARALTGDHPRARPPTPESLAEIDPETALDFYRQRFADAGDFTFFITGSVDLDALQPLVEIYLGSLPAGGRTEEWVDHGIGPPDGVHRIEVRRGIEPKSRAVVVFHGEAEWSREGLHQARSFGEALAIRLREVLREELGATYDVDVGAGLVSRPRPRYRVQVSFGCDPELADELLGRLFDELRAVRAGGLGEEIAAKVREQQRRRRELALRDNGYWMAALAFYYEHGLDPRLILDYDSLVESVTAGSLRRAAERYLDFDRFVQAVLYPEGGEEN